MRTMATPMTRAELLRRRQQKQALQRLRHHITNALRCPVGCQLLRACLAAAVALVVLSWGRIAQCLTL